MSSFESLKAGASFCSKMGQNCFFLIFHVPLMFTGCPKVTNDQTAVQGSAVGRGIEVAIETTSALPGYIFIVHVL